MISYTHGIRNATAISVTATPLGVKVGLLTLMITSL